jgi:hypothetical protein
MTPIGVARLDKLELFNTESPRRFHPENFRVLKSNPTAPSISIFFILENLCSRGVLKQFRALF